ncbi:MAG: hypothetical protein O8C66_01150 [Candidatus Methanoperedens sp.]|nr:hypothetical protein [Candidatus Methanoperedens sp.]MCZ7369094.1 hypothetical protein [Candidatus Methanoperedens sp.]
MKDPMSFAPKVPFLTDFRCKALKGTKFEKEIKNPTLKDGLFKQWQNIMIKR